MAGDIVGIDAESGDIRWTYSTNMAVINSNTRILQSISGHLYLETDRGLKKHPMHVREIVNNSPFSFGDGIIHMGSKQTHYYVLNAETGWFKIVFGLTRQVNPRNAFQLRVPQKIALP